MRRLLLAVLCVAGHTVGAGAQVATDRLWKVSPHEEPGWTAPSFDDSRWTTPAGPHPDAWSGGDPIAWPRDASALPLWSGPQEPRAYLKRAVVNACRSAQRRQVREDRRTVEPVEPSVELGGDELFDALARLPYRQRAAIVLRFSEGLPDAEIAAALDGGVGTVASLGHRGLAELRKVIDR